MKHDIIKALKADYKIFIPAILLPLFVGGLSALLTGDNMNIYEELKTPAFSPPAIIFPIVWTALYILMGISSGIIWLNREKNTIAATKGLFIYIISLAFNFLWSIVFFNMRKFLAAFVILLMLLYLILNTIQFYSKVSKKAAYLQIPYLLWVTFAGYLNIAIWFLN